MISFRQGLYSLSICMVVLVFASCRDVFAYAAPPMEIVDSKVSPDCAIVRGWQIGIPEASSESATAIKIQNTCDYELLIKSIKTKTSDAEEQKPIDEVAGFFETTVRRRSHYIRFVAKGQVCSSDVFQELDKAPSCGGIALKKDEQITITMKRGTFYFVSGEPSLDISGHFINPSHSPGKLLLTDE